MNQPKPAIEQFQERALRVLGEYFPVPAPNKYKYANAANAFALARTFPLDGFLPSDQMMVTQAHIEIAAGNINPTADWSNAFREFFASAGQSFNLRCNDSLFERYLAGRCPSPELLVQLASDHVVELAVTADAANEAARGKRHEELFHELAPALLTDGPNRYQLAIDNKRIEERRLAMWNMSLEELEALKAKKNLRNMSKEELKAIVKGAEPARVQKFITGERHDAAEPQQVIDLRNQAAVEVAAGRYGKLPDQFRVPGKDIFLDWSFALLNQLPKEMVKNLIERYGNSQISAACHTTRFRLLQKQQA
jgi:hypothetical protein